MEPKRAALRFQVDWKDNERSALPDCYREPKCGRDTRTRTRIDWEKSGAKPGALFSISSIVPGPTVRWVAVIRFPEAIPDDAVRHLLDALDGSTVAGLGRTDALLSIRVRRPMLPPKTVSRIAADHVIVCLESPAVMFDRAALESVDWDAQAAYGAYWQERGFHLIEAIADQQLQGGHIAIRYPPGMLRDPQSTEYEPFIVTLPGSVFKLRVLASDAAQLQVLLETGLPLPDALRARANWRTCPFLPTNGYGECRTVRPGEHRESQL